MLVLQARNVQQAFPKAIQILLQSGQKRNSRNGPVLQYPTPVTTVYDRPVERVLFWEDRDANPFFHLFEALWMLSGRNDTKGVAFYASNMSSYSDDGETLHGAYGYRWRQHFSTYSFPDKEHVALDQLHTIISTLKNNHDDRRCVLQMWDPMVDLGRNGKDLPCNLTATFQVNTRGELDLTVFCRSNDIVWGAYGANAVHFSILLEYVANAIEVPMGRYYQVSINWHGYLETLSKVSQITPDKTGYIEDPYVELDSSRPIAVPTPLPKDISKFNRYLVELMMHEHYDFTLPPTYNDDEPFFDVARVMLKAYRLYKFTPKPQGYDLAFKMLSKADQHADWIIAGKQWMERRQAKWLTSHNSATV